MIDITTEHVVSFTQATKTLPHRRGGKRPHVATLYRWAQRGCKGVRLETVQVGGTRCTSMEALQRFFNHLTGAGVPDVAAKGVTQSPSETKRTFAAVERELEAEGL